jgi:hypothetical protein
VNRFFVSGVVQAAPEIAFTPKGDKIVVFPLSVQDGGFTLEIVFRGALSTGEMNVKTGSPVMASGELVKATGKSRAAYRLRANKIVVMEG